MSVSKVVQQVWAAQEETPRRKKRVKMWTPDQIIKKPREYINVKGELWESIGRLEKGTKIFIKGPSYSGKSSVLIMLCKPALEVMTVHYNNHEEKGGDAGTVKRKLLQAGFGEGADPRFKFYKAHIEDAIYETWEEILSKKSRPGMGILDSVQHACLTKRDYLRITETYCEGKGMVGVFVSHWVNDDYAKFLKHDADVKLDVMGYVCYVESRLEDATNKPIVIWEEGAKRHWGKRYRQVITGKYWPGKKK